MHRSQKDPLAADEEAPQRVLVPIALKSEKSVTSSSASKPKVTTNEITYVYNLCLICKIPLTGSCETKRRTSQTWNIL